MEQSANKKRSAARLSAVQSLYSMAVTGQDTLSIIANFQGYGSVAHLGDIDFPADEELFTRIVTGVKKRNDDIIEIANKALKKHPIERLQPTLSAIIQCGIFELIDDTKGDSKLIISEYVDIAHSFFNPAEAGLVNGVLDTIAKVVRG